MMRVAHVASRAFHRPLLLEPRSGLPLLTTLAGLIARSSLDDPLRPMAFDDDRDGPRDRMVSLPIGIAKWDRDKTFPQVKNVALIEVDGTLVNKNGTVGAYCGMTGYDGIRTQLNAALADDDVAGIALYIESPGGEVAGCFDLADAIYAARGQKPILAIVDGMACSAAYALAAACDRITCSSVGLLGSIGVIVAHMSYEKLLEKAGVEVTLIFAGAHKADGNPFAALPKSVQADLQAEINAIAAQFHAQAARGRGLSAEIVKKLEAQTFLAPQALELRLCDAVMAPADALEQFIQALS
jgi:signal peptide peptidase SppA